MHAVTKAGAVVLFSGGQDSTTCLAWALDRFDYVETIGFDYGQRHAVELDCRGAIRGNLASQRKEWAGRLGSDHLLTVDALQSISGTAMTEKVAIHAREDGLPNTFVPGRNIVFLTLSGALAYRRGLGHLVTGVCETDYSGYPDCRDDTIKSLQATLNLGMATRLVIHTPLMWVDKAATWSMAWDIGGEELVDLIRWDSHSCYLGDRDQRWDWGYGCGSCPACELRSEGWQAFLEARAKA